jgi:hypothetical protein
MFNKKKNDLLIETSKMSSDEVINTYARLNLFQKAALLRLLIRDVIFEINGEAVSGLQFEDIEVDGAIIIAKDN